MSSITQEDINNLKQIVSILKQNKLLSIKLGDLEIIGNHLTHLEQEQTTDIVEEKSPTGTLVDNIESDMTDEQLLYWSTKPGT